MVSRWGGAGRQAEEGMQVSVCGNQETAGGAWEVQDQMQVQVGKEKSF